MYAGVTVTCAKSSRRLLSAFRRRVLLGTLAAALVLFHAGLLWQRVVDQSLLQPAVGLRWALSLAILLVGLRLRRAGLSLLTGRPAIGLWAVVLLLHAGGVPVAADPLATTPAGLVTIPLFMGGVAGLALALVGVRGATVTPAALRPRLWRYTAALLSLPPWRAFGSPQLSRPPPA